MLDLVPQSAVKVNDVTVGAVDDDRARRLDRPGHRCGCAGRVQAARQRRRRAPADQPARREVRLAGAAADRRAASGRLGDGDTIPLARTGRNPEVEEVLGALSLLLNGGGVAQLKTIETRAQQRAMEGREDDIQGADQPARHLHRRPGRAEGRDRPGPRRLDRLSARLAAQKDDIADGPRRPGPGGLKVLADQREQLDHDAHGADRPRRVGTRVINASQGRHRRPTCGRSTPILTQLAEAGDDLPNVARAAAHLPVPAAATGGDARATTPTCAITADLDLRDHRWPTSTAARTPACRPCRRSRTRRCRSRPCPSPTVPTAPACRCRPCPRRPRRPCRRATAAVCVPGVCLACARPARPRAALRHHPGARSDDGGPGMIRRAREGPAGRVPAHHAGRRVSYVSARYVGLGDRVARRPATSSSADFAESGGIFVGRRGDLPRRQRRPGRPAAPRRRRRASSTLRHRPAASRSPRTPSPSSRTARRSASSTSTCSPGRRAGRASPTATSSPRTDTRTPLRVDTLLLDLDRTGELGRQGGPRSSWSTSSARRFADGGTDLQRLLDTATP